MDYEIGNAVKTETRSEINISYDGTGKYIPYCLCLFMHFMAGSTTKI